MKILVLFLPLLSTTPFKIPYPVDVVQIWGPANTHNYNYFTAKVV